MSQPYTKTVIEQNVTTTAVSATVPAGKVWIVQSMVAVAAPGTAGALIIFVSGNVAWGVSFASPPGYSSQFYDGKVALRAGQNVTAAMTAASCSVTVTVWELDA